jgi:D-glycerate 3-kinase
VIANPIPDLIYRLIQERRSLRPGRPALIGVAGAQGSGKTHVCMLLEAANRPRFAHFSLDDVYLTKAEREAKAREAHPLFATRGPPGTHDLDLAIRTIDDLTKAAPSSETSLPRFDKARDDRAPESEWPIYRGQPEAVLFDGWCVGALPDALGASPINQLEAEEDADGRWRALVRSALASEYQRFFDRFDAIVYLQAPNWEIVRQWRGQQEEQTLRRKMTAKEEAKLNRFLMAYERITKNMMAGAHRATQVVKLDEARRAINAR